MSFLRGTGRGYFSWVVCIPTIYTGPDSCYARREGIFVARIGRPGIDKVAEAAGIITLIIRDMRRGWTYDGDTVACRKIRMTKDLFIKRVNYVRVLARKVVSPNSFTYASIDSLVEYVLTHGRLPATIVYRGRRYSVRRLAEAVISKV